MAPSAMEFDRVRTNNIDGGEVMRGFSLLEAAILLVAVAVVAALLLPRYEAWQRAEFRAQARTALVALADELEARFRDSGTYAGAALRDGEQADTGPPALMPAVVPSEGAPRYRLRIAIANDRGYEIRAEPLADQTEDPCGTLTLTATGVRGIEDAEPGVRIDECWGE